MNLNKLEKLEPYKDFDGSISGSMPSDEQKKPLTRKERRLREKLEAEYKEIVSELPKKPNFEEGVRQAVKEIRSCYRFDNYMKISDALIQSFSHPGDYVMTKAHAIISFYARIIGAIDKNIDDAQNRIDFRERFDDTNPEAERRKQKLLNLREKLVIGFEEDADKTWIESEIIKAISDYPTHSHFGELFQTLKDENEVKSDVVYLCIAYNEGYASDNLKPEKIEMIYNSGKAKLLSQKAINEGEYQKTIKRVRK